MANSLGEQLDAIFAAFEQKTDWRLSLPAKVIIQQGIISIGMDTLGMGDYAQPNARGPAIQVALSKLPTFLDDLKAEAEKRPNAENDSRIIGGIFVLQHAKSWKTLFGCACWPI
jgi:hypothetical protein